MAITSVLYSEDQRSIRCRGSKMIKFLIQLIFGQETQSVYVHDSLEADWQ